MNIQQLTYVAPRKPRVYQPYQFRLVWAQDGLLYGQSYKYEVVARKAAQQLINSGFDPQLIEL